MKAISVKNPWAWAIIYGGKDIENRTWKTNFRGRVFIHAGLNADKNAPDHVWDLLPEDVAIFGGIIGTVEIVDCVQASESKWFMGPWGWVLRDPKPISFIPYKGRLGLFDVEI